MPTRCCRNRAGPCPSRRMSRARTPSSGASRTSATAASSRSRLCLITPTDAGERRLLEVEQREGVGRPDGDARTGDVGERRRDEQLHGGALELPGQAPDRSGGEGVRQHGDGVGADDPGGRVRQLGWAEHGQLVAADLEPGDLLRRAGPDDGEARLRPRGRLAGQGAHGVLRTDGEDAVHPVPPSPQRMQHLPHDGPAQHGQQEEQREGGQRGSPRRCPPEAERRREGQGDRAHAGLERPPQLDVDPGLLARVVAAGHGVETEPQDRDGRGRPDGGRAAGQPRQQGQHREGDGERVDGDEQAEVARLPPRRGAGTGQAVLDDGEELLLGGGSPTVACGERGVGQIEDPIGGRVVGVRVTIRRPDG